MTMEIILRNSIGGYAYHSPMLSTGRYQGLLALLLTCTHQSLVFESCRYIFTADPRGKLKLWRLCNPSQSASQNSAISNNVSLIAEFISSFNIRIMCLDASSEEEVFSFYHVSNLIRVRIFLFMV